jgi:hypothetical protein
MDGLVIPFLLLLYIPTIILFIYYIKNKNITENVFFNGIRIFAVIWGFFDVFMYNISTQLMNCNRVDAKSAAIGATPVIITMTLGLLIANVKKFRIPIVSLFNSEAKCCQKDISIDEIEQKNPFAKMAAYLFYLGFALLFGIVFGSEFASC